MSKDICEYFCCVKYFEVLAKEAFRRTWGDQNDLGMRVLIHSIALKDVEEPVDIFYCPFCGQRIVWNI